MKRQPALEGDQTLVNRDLAAHRVFFNKVRFDVVGEIVDLVQLIVAWVAKGLIVHVQIT